MGNPTLRNDIASGLKALLDAFSAANTGYLNGTYRSRPASMGNRPLAFVGPRNETVLFTGGSIFQRNPTPSVWFVWASSANQQEIADVRDDVIDAFLQYAGVRPHAVSNDTTVSPTGVEDVEVELDGAFYPASVVTFTVFAMGGTT